MKNYLILCSWYDLTRKDSRGSGVHEVTSRANRSSKKMKYCTFLFLFLISSATQAQDESLLRGVYGSFDDYKAGTTEVIDSFYLDSVPRKKDAWLGTYSVTPKFSKNDRKVKRIWGFYDGTQSWIGFQNDFFPLVIQNGHITFEAYGTVDNTNAAISWLLFGAIGAGIYSVTANAEAKGERITYILDPNNGLIYTADDIGLGIQTWDVELGAKKLVIYRGTKKEIDVPIVFLVNDTLVDDFVPGSYVEIEVIPKNSQVDICFGNAFKECETILLTGAVQYVECAYTKKSDLNDYEFLSVNKSKGEHDSVWSYDVQERRKRRERRQRKSDSKDE